MPARPSAIRLPLFGFPGACLLLGLGCAPGQTEDAFDDVAREASLVDGSAIEGRYERRIASMLDGTSRTSHHVKTLDGVYELVFDALPEIDDGALEYDSWVRVPGGALEENRWEAADLVVVAPPPQPLIDPDARLPRRIGTVLVFWDGQGLTNASATDSMYTGNKSTNVYYGENSYGRETISGKVFGPYQIERPASCNVDQIVSRAQAAMIDKGHDPTQFRQMMFYFPSGLGCGFAGLASVGSPDNPARNSWYSGSFGCTTRNQELGHNYGMGHSHAYSCPPVPEGMDHNEYGNCGHIEYGHPYDPMGKGCGHMNVVQKTYMGWLQECNVVTATSDGVFNLMPNELPCNGTQALRFPASDGRYYYLEYRNGTGLFPAGSGVLINLANEVGGFGPTNYVLDRLGSNNNGYLHEGDSFTDPGGSSVFTVLEEHSTHAVIQVTLPDGGDGLGPSCRGGGEPIEEGGAIGSMECAAIPYPGDDSPPEVQITYPTDGEHFPVGAAFTITAEAADDRGVIELELYLDGKPFDIRTEPPWEWPATNIPAGTYEFGVVARDARAWTPSNAVTIHVGMPASADETGADESAGEDSTGVLGTTGDDDTTGGDLGQTGTDDGCGCRQTSHPRGALGFGLLVLGLGWLRRRRLAA